jgi:hypothetical protein
MLLQRRLTDGADDKKCELVYIDRDARVAVACSAPFHAALTPLLKQSIPIGGGISAPVSQFTSLVQATRTANQPIYREFASHVDIGLPPPKSAGKTKKRT